MLAYAYHVAPALKQRYAVLGSGCVSASRGLRDIRDRGLGEGGGVSLNRPRTRWIHVSGRQCTDRTVPGDDRQRQQILEKVLLRGGSPFLTKAVQLLPSADRASLESFSNALSDQHASGGHLDRHYALLRKNGLHHHLTIHAMQRLLKRIASDPGSFHPASGEPPSEAILRLLDDYRPLGFGLGASEYSSLIRALAAEPGRETEALELVDTIVDRSEVAPFLRARKGKRGLGTTAVDRIPSDEEIARIDEALTSASAEDPGQPTAASTETDHSGAALPQDGARGADWIQALAAEHWQARSQEGAQAGGDRLVRISRTFYHMAMRGFAHVYHVRGVLAILNRMLESATQVPFRIARHLMPNRETWDIVGEVLARQRDRPTFVKAWVGFLSRGTRPPTGLTRSLVRLLVYQSCVEQAIWVMCISRCLPDAGDKPTQAPFAEGTVPWELKVQTMHVASALEAASALEVTHMTPVDALHQGRVATQLPMLGRPDPDIYAHLIGGAVRMQSAKLAERLFQELVDAGVAPVGATFGHLASLYADRGKTNRVFMIVREMLIQEHRHVAQAGTADQGDGSAIYGAVLRRRTSQLRADVECIVPLLRFYLQTGKSAEALSLLRSWDLIHEQRVPAEKLALALARVYNRPEDSAAIASISQRLQDALACDAAAPAADAPSDSSRALAAGLGRSADKGTLLQVYGQAIRTHFLARNIPGVLKVLRDIAASGLSPPFGMWETVLRGFLREQALDLFDAVHVYLRDTLRTPLSLPLYSHWMQTLRNHGDVVGTQAAFDEMISLGQVPNQQHYLYLVQAYAYDGWIEQAMSIVNNLRKPHSSLRAGLNIDIAAVEAFVACGDMERAEEELRYLLDNTHLPTRRIPARPFNYIIIGYLHAGNGQKAMRTYEEMVRLGVTPDTYTFAVLMQSYAVANDLANCMRVFNEMVRVGVAPDIVVYTIMICAFGLAKKVINAEAVFKQITHEQDWARSLVAKQGLQRADAPLAHTAPETLDAYAEALAAGVQVDTAQTADADSSTVGEQLRLRGFFNLDPVVYIAMLSVYRQSGRTMSALATWERLVSNFPIVQWSPRDGGAQSATLHYTGRFHMPAWTLVLRTARDSIGVTQARAVPPVLHPYFNQPLFTGTIADTTKRRRRHRRSIRLLLRSGAPSAATRKLGTRMAARLRLAGEIEKELDARIEADRSFCMEHRHSVALPVLDELQPFVDFEYWIPAGMSRVALDAAHNSLPADGAEGPVEAAADRPRPQPGVLPSLPSSMTKKGRHAKESAQGIVAILARQWRTLEDSLFKFSNIHVAEYIPCMLVGRQYSELRRFLLLVEPPAESGARHTHYRYRNITLDKHQTRLLARQMRLVRGQLLAARERRTVLSALTGHSSELAATYAVESAYGLVDKQRSPDEMQVMHERLVVHSERELSWASELRALIDIAHVWSRLVPIEDQKYLVRVVRQASLTLR